VITIFEPSTREGYKVLKCSKPLFKNGQLVELREGTAGREPESPIPTILMISELP
jgi:hypothetical protein